MYKIKGRCWIANIWGSKPTSQMWQKQWYAPLFYFTIKQKGCTPPQPTILEGKRNTQTGDRTCPQTWCGSAHDKSKGAHRDISKGRGITSNRPLRLNSPASSGDARKVAAQGERNTSARSASKGDWIKLAPGLSKASVVDGQTSPPTTKRPHHLT